MSSVGPFERAVTKISQGSFSLNKFPHIITTIKEFMRLFSAVFMIRTGEPCFIITDFRNGLR